MEINYTNRLRIERLGNKGDKTKDWGYLIGVSMTSVTGFVKAENLHNHWVIRITGGFPSNDGRCIEDILCYEKGIDNADKRIHEITLSKLAYPSKSRLESEYPGMKIYIDDETEHAEKS